MSAFNSERLRRILLMILLTATFYASAEWYFIVPFSCLAAASLLYQDVLTSWLFWALTSALLGFALVQLWLIEGNHLYLLFYLSLMALVATSSDEPLKVVRHNARLLIGCIFALAIVWKLITPEFMSSTFFSYYLVQDARLAPIALLVTDLTRTDVLANRETLSGAWDETMTLRSTVRVERLAIVLTWLTFVVEAAVAAAFLIPAKQFERIRDPALIIFLTGAYLVVPVPSFGMSFACLGYAQTNSLATERLYLILFILMPLTSLRYYVSTL